MKNRQTDASKPPPQPGTAPISKIRQVLRRYFSPQLTAQVISEVSEEDPLARARRIADRASEGLPADQIAAARAKLALKKSKR